MSMGCGMSIRSRQFVSSHSAEVTAHAKDKHNSPQPRLEDTATVVILVY